MRERESGEVNTVKNVCCPTPSKYVFIRSAYVVAFCASILERKQVFHVAGNLKPSTAPLCHTVHPLSGGHQGLWQPCWIFDPLETAFALRKLWQTSSL